ncbi:dihydrolipoamide dehydrogenase [Natronospira proteinivora]|uniref:Dihydrolipoyl dehydrogenase n=1 Tax=Natronospira proteinivora TaxID=1807133 RepID=A0ABT1G514_9GAMM|nr:dihydrolipoyl dehydrogenase [Natronospira proteinivora]MCP1726389.1 dihydrolipoamide dehydrogenase [Natronospira proteinivora]
MSKSFDVVVIGGGPGGYVAAIRAAQNGLTTACVDNWQNRDDSHAFGGTCLNAGCIPSKAMLESSELYHRAGHEFDQHGINVGKPKLDLAAMLKRKDGIAKQFTGGIAQLFKANKVEGIPGTGKLLKGNKVEVTPLGGGKKQTIEAKHVILATGSTPVELPFAKFDGERIVDSWDALEFEEVPKRLGVIGAGVIGLEMGSVWSRLGSEVTMIEAQDKFLFMADQQIAKDAQRQFKKQGLDIKLGAKLVEAKAGKKDVKIVYEDKDGKQEATFDKLLISVGRRPYTDDLFGDGVKVETDDRGFIKVDKQNKTSAKNVWAVGDCAPGPMLAHKASEEGVVVADLIAGKTAEMNHDTIPNIIYTAPEVAWVGKTEEELKEEKVPYKVGTFGFAANGRAQAMNQASGMVKMLAHKESDEVLGVHITGPMASELIAEAVLAMEFRASAEDIQLTIHAHPALGEVIHEAALAVDKKALHGVNR